jgi:hypothetical protein
MGLYTYYSGLRIFWSVLYLMSYCSIRLEKVPLMTNDKVRYHLTLCDGFRQCTEIICPNRTVVKSKR